jgi:outer membrane immunogenic protein
LNNLLVGTALLTLASGSAMAADLSRPAPVYSKAPMVAPFSWTGFYVGGDGAYGYATSSGTAANFAGVFPVPYSFNVHGPVAGGFVGGNYQMGAFVLGAEADWQWANLTGTSGAVAAIGGPYTFASTVKSYGSARGRLGYALDHWLFYGTAGWAWGTWSTSYGFAGAAPFFTNSASSNKGWTAGAGFEYAFTNYLLGRVEYRYTNLGTVTGTPRPIHPISETSWRSAISAPASRSSSVVTDSLTHLRRVNRSPGPMPGAFSRWMAAIQRHRGDTESLWRRDDAMHFRMFGTVAAWAQTSAAKWITWSPS